MTEASAAVERLLEDEGATAALGARLAGCCPPGTVIHLAGELGTGKSTLARGFIRALGHRGPVRSPTFTLLEPYEALRPPVIHLDLYRLSDPEELEFLGLRDYLGGETVLLVEWPQRGAGHVPAPDLVVALQPAGGGRQVRLTPYTPRGRACLGDVAPP